MEKIQKVMKGLNRLLRIPGWDIEDMDQEFIAKGLEVYDQCETEEELKRQIVNHCRRIKNRKRESVSIEELGLSYYSDFSSPENQEVIDMIVDFLPPRERSLYNKFLDKERMRAEEKELLFTELNCIYNRIMNDDVVSLMWEKEERLRGQFGR